MKATAKNFFGTNLEQEVLDEVVLWEGVALHNHSITLTNPYTDFEYLYFHGAFSTTSGEVFNLAAGYLDKDTLMKATLNTTVGTRAESSNYVSVNIQRVSDKEFKMGIYNSAAWVGRLVKVVGYKRRISRIGIDELMSAMSLPNLIANADLTDNPINQRGFNGNWSSLAVGAYGYDQWMKVSSTHMGAVIEAGKYRPNAKHTLTKDDALIAEFMSPASGHWIIAVPFSTSGKFDLYAGQFKRPWHPVQDGLERCLRYYLVTDVRSSNSPYSSGYVMFGTIPFPVPMMRKTPNATFTDTYLSPASGWSEMTMRISCNATGVSRIVRNTTLAKGDTCYIDSTIAVDSTITLDEVNGQITTV